MRARLTALWCAVALVSSFLAVPSPATAQSTSCADYDAYEWAQAVFESDPDTFDALDADGDGQACPDLPRGGFAPAFWLDSIPEEVEEAEIIRTIDGDTFEVLIDGVSNRVRIYRADTPETQNEQHCGGAEATAFADFALSFNDTPGTIYLERDENTRDRFGRELAYVWFEVDGLPYLLNHILISNGWAEDVDFGDRKYDAELEDAAAFAERNDLGVWAQCGGFGIDLADAPAQAPAEPAPANPSVGGVSGNNESVSEPEPEVVEEEPVFEEPEVVEEAPAAQGGCDPNYTPCVPISSSDLDCGDIGFSVTIIGSDPHGFDGNDNDGFGCESY